MSLRAAGWVFEELRSSDPLDARLDAARQRIDDADGGGRLDAALRYAIVAALAGDVGEAHVGVHYARDLRSRSEPAASEVVASFVALRAGDPQRALAAWRRAHPHGVVSGSESAEARALEAEALLLNGALEEAALAALDARSGAEPEVATWLDLLLAEVAVAQGAWDEAERRLAACASAPGLLRARRQLLEAGLGLQTGAPLAQVRGAVSMAVWRLVPIGAPLELGLGYLAMSEVEAASGADRRVAADWLARAQPLLARAGRPADLRRLRAAFRTWGRRAVDRVTEGEAGDRIEALRERRDVLLDLASALADELRLRVPDAAMSTDVAGVAEPLVSASEEIITSLERAMVDRERVGQLIQAGRRLMPLERADDVIRSLPELALGLGVGDSAEVLELGRDGALRVLVSHGQPSAAARMDGPLRRALDSGEPQLFSPGAALAPGSQPPVRPTAAALPIRNDRRDLVLVLAVASPTASIRDADLERLRLFVSLASTSLERAMAVGSLALSASRDAATVEAIRDGVLTVDAEGRVTSLNRAGARLLRLAPESLVGRVLGEERPVAPLAALLERDADVDDAIVSLPKLDLLVRLRFHAGGGVLSFTERARAERRAQRLVGSDARFDFADIVGSDPALRRVVHDARRAAQVDVPILITGESGTGKEVLAQAIHNASPRAGSPFVGVNVAAIPRELIESELFGYEPGAFTGARPGGHPGKFELAQDGTLLLDEIGELSAELQAKLLRVLQERKVQRLGGTRSLPIRARVLATTHRDLEAAVDEGSFRLDLYYRLKVVHLELPPLRERRGDVPLLVEHYLRQFAAAAGRAPLEVDPEVMRAFVDYPWPGNVRELANVVEAEASLSPPDARRLSTPPRALVHRVRRRHSSAPPGPGAGAPPADAPVLPMAEVERRVYAHALEACGGRVVDAAKALGVSRATFYNKMKRYELRRG